MALAEFGAEPLPFPTNERAKEMFDRMDEEFNGLPEVITGARDYVASFCILSMFKLLEDEGCSHFLKFGAYSYQFPLASRIDEEEKSKNIKVVKLNFYKQLWLLLGVNM